MRIQTPAIAAAVISVLLPTSLDAFDFVGSEDLSGIPVTEEARYRCSFRNLWTAESHPTLYPVDSAAWADQHFVTHSNRYKPWTPGSPASDAFASLASTGDPLLWTIEALSQNEAVMDIEVGGVFAPNGGPPEKVIGVIRITPSAPFLTTMAVMTPSPDWFTGVSQLDLRQNTGDPLVPQMWYREVEIDTYPYTAGTLSGTTYIEAGDVLDPVEPIRQMTADTPPASSSGVLLDSTGTVIPPVARWTCTILAAVPITPPGNSDGPPGNSDGAPGNSDGDDGDAIAPPFDDGSVILSGMESIEPTMGGTVDGTVMETYVMATNAPTSEVTTSPPSATKSVQSSWPREPNPV
ncbi:Spondin-1 [Seminavis robusta]|uniref:Spondin-1 n=1 Tax=Seminavis robusta TaxID=568900 RepID=A0A9N8EDD3_9STRA|nr:Spondin-1 [Seminavis robusta]|eukprot:Sro831_g208400.1 Spondin-1 (350) ;mRNA; r:41569-42730